MHWNCRRSEEYDKDLLEEHVILIFKKLGVVIEAMGMVTCHRLGETSRVIVKLLNRKEAQNILEEKPKLRSINLYDDNTHTKTKIFINQSLCPYYRKLYGMVQGLNNEVNRFFLDCKWDNKN